MPGERSLAGTAGSYVPSTPANWPGGVPTTIQDALDAVAAASGGALTLRSRTITANFTIDSVAGQPDAQLNLNSLGGPFNLTLPDPTKNAGRVLTAVDFGENLAAENVTLVRHGAEKINGTAASLALATNGARYDISCDGTNWQVNKSVAGG